MKRHLVPAIAAALTMASPLSAQSRAEPIKAYPAPTEIVAAAKPEEWQAIAPADILVMTLAPDATAKQREVVIQLIPPPFSKGWVDNIRKLAAAKWWDGTSINRVQDNYVVQWGDATEKKALPDGLETLPESAYVTRLDSKASQRSKRGGRDLYAYSTSVYKGWPIGIDSKGNAAPVHCYGMVGVGRNLSPDTGTGAELYTVIGHAPRHLDRNIALAGRVIEGIEHLSSLPRGTGALGFYEKEAERVTITSVRLASDVAELGSFEYLATDSKSFAVYAEARANRRDPFFIRPAGGADICNIPVPIRRKPK